jgi:hypothetical protein
MWPLLLTTRVYRISSDDSNIVLVRTGGGSFGQNCGEPLEV